MTVQELIEKLKEMPREVNVVFPMGSSFAKVHNIQNTHECLVVDGYEDIQKKEYVKLLPKE